MTDDDAKSRDSSREQRLARNEALLESWRVRLHAMRPSEQHKYVDDAIENAIENAWDGCDYCESDDAELTGWFEYELSRLLDHEAQYGRE